MGCNSDYMNQTHKEKLLQQTAQLFSYLLESLGHSVPPQLEAAANDFYCKTDFVPQLCASLKGLTEEQKQVVMWDGRKKMARRLAQWWEDHCAADAARDAKWKEAEQHLGGYF